MLNQLKQFINNRIKYDKDNKIEISKHFYKVKRKKQRKEIGVLIVADVHGAEGELARLLDEYKGLPYEFIVSLGDLSVENIKYLVKFAKTQNKPLYAIRGNHDTYKLEDIDDYIINIDEKVVKYKGLKFIGIEGSNYYNDYSTYKDDEALFNKDITEPIDVIFSHTKACTYADKDSYDARKGLVSINKIMANCGVRKHFYGHFHNSSKMNNIYNIPSKCIYMVEYQKIQY